MEKFRKYFAEFIGTMVLVFMGCGSAMLLGCDAAGGHLAVALTFGLAIVAMAYGLGHVSGCHVNPAVSFAMLLQRKISLTDFCGYVVAQFVGATVAAALLKGLTQLGVNDLTGALGSNGIANAGGLVGAFAIEVILTAIFVFTILGVTSDSAKKSVAGFVIGLTLTFVHIVGIPLTGTSVNPARSFGPALFAGGEALGSLWVFLVAPLLGAAMATLVFRILTPPEKTK